MVAIGNGKSSALLRESGETTVVALTKSDDAKKAPAAAASTAATKIDLSDRAKSIIARAQAEIDATRNLTKSFDEILTERTDALGKRLSDAFSGLNVPPEFATYLKVDKVGNVTTEGPWTAKIEKLFRDDPELAKELKEVAGLNALKAAQASLDLYTEQKKSTNDETKQAEAWKNYHVRALNIQTLSGVMTVKDGKLRSAAVDYVDMIADPTGIKSGKSRQDVADRLV